MWKPVIRPLIAITLSAAAIACGSSGGAKKGDADAKNDQAQSAPAINITVGKSESRDIASAIKATGSLVANESSNVAPKSAGKIANLNIEVGDFVSAGAVIAKVDDRDAKLQLSSALAAVKVAKSAVRQAEAKLGLLGNGKFSASSIPEVRVANANYEQAQAELKQAEANEKRYRELTESGDVAMITYEQYRTQRDTARSRANAAKEQLEAAINTAKQSNQAIASAQAQVESAETQVADAQQAIADTVIRAPFAGFVSSRPVAVGEYVSSASVVATILRTNPIKVQIQVAEADSPYVAPGRGVSLEVDAFKDRKFAGTVSSINPAIDPVSRAAVVEALVENSDNALRPGMFANVRINKDGGSKAVFVPRSAVINDEATQSYRVFVIQDGVAKLKTVQIGSEENGFVQIVTGVEPDLTVATGKLEQLYEGAKVTF